jgi:hypothetical protein
MVCLTVAFAFSYDYCGYGASEGKPSEKDVHADVEAAYAGQSNLERIPPLSTIPSPSRNNRMRQDIRPQDINSHALTVLFQYCFPGF